MLGILVLATFTGVGGGIVRDLILGVTPPAVFQEEAYLVVCLLGGLVSFFLTRFIEGKWSQLMIADAIGLGVFAAIGAAKAATYGLGPVGIMTMAGVTATGGGVLRDILVREVPAVLQKDFYASAALLGGAGYVLAGMMGFPEWAQLSCTLVITIVLRFLAMFKGFHLPKARF